jgi:hypothetical protein
MTRPARAAPFGSVELLGLTPDGGGDQDPHVLGDESALYFARVSDGGGRRLWRAAGDSGGGFTQPEVIPLGPGDHHNPSVSDDELELYVAAGEAGVERASRASIAVDFGALAPADDLNAPKYGGGDTRPGWISPDGCRMYFASGALSQIYVAERTPR